MKTVGESRRKAQLLLALALLAFPALSRAADMNDYCITPPFVQAKPKPNLLLLMDNSASMYDLAYTASAAGTYCYDNTYNNGSSYAGYFSKDVVYSYEYDAALTPPYKFASGSSIPTSGGTYRTAYFYIEMTGTAGSSTRKVTVFRARGNFLNWLAASKFDVQKQALTGGRYEAGGYLQAESRGCVGRRFVKEVPTADWLTPTPSGSPPGVTLSFAVRGPDATDPDNIYGGIVGGGNTRIEIFEANFNEADCIDAVTAWTSDNLGQVATSSGQCLGVSGGGGTASGRELGNFTETVRDCFSIKQNIKAIQSGTLANTEANLFRNVTLNNLEVQCALVYNRDCSGYADIADCPALKLTNPNGNTRGNYLCSAGNTHLDIPDGFYTFKGDDTGGFVGNCWKEGSSSFAGKDSCVKRELLHYCYGMQETEVVDPTSDILSSDAQGNVPAILMDAGLRSSGDPVGFTGAGDNQFQVRVAVNSESAGLIQKFQNQIRIGAMEFNSTGSASESSVPGWDSSSIDGGKLTSFIGAPGNCSATVATQCTSDLDCPGGEVCNQAGNHSAGLIRTLSQMGAGNWTPYAEAYYNAIAYFTKDAATTNTTLNSTKFTADATAIKAPLSSTQASYSNKNPILSRCQSNFILIISDGGSTADQNTEMTTKVLSSGNYFRDPNTLTEEGNTVKTCGGYKGSPYLHDLSYFAQHRDIFHPATFWTQTANEQAQKIGTYVVYTGPTTSALTGVCDPYTEMQKTAANGGSTLYLANDPGTYMNSLESAFRAMVGSGASGTAASILSNSEGSGANILQAVFYPKKQFANKKCSASSASCTSDTDCPAGQACINAEVSWVGEMQDLWYYIDPKLSNSTVREDTNYTPPNPGDPEQHYLNLKSDYVTQFYFDQNLSETRAMLTKDSNGDGSGDSVPPAESRFVTTNPAVVSPDDVKSLWRAGRLLWSRSADDRTIKANVGGSLIDFSAANKGNATLQNYLQVPGNASAAETLINYVRGVDNSSYRNRTVALTSGGASHVWKLGDIISSTPRLQSSSRLNSYNLPPAAGYGDKTYGDDNAKSGFIYSSAYLQRGTAYVSANDGMLHAFNLGSLDVTPSGDKKATLSGTDLGKEVWAFVPQSVLPYLKYLADRDYSHLYVLDGTTTIVDASIGTTSCTETDYWKCARTADTWRTVLIGSMGIGGASNDAGDGTCTDKSAGSTCVKSPLSGAGRSSYFALDITDPGNPQLLWEVSPDGLGFATTGAVVARVAARKADGTLDPDKNGRWFAVFASGPTGPIDTTVHRFMGRSNQPLSVFVVDLATGTVVRTIDRLYNNTVISNAFAGSLTNAPIDTDRWNRFSPGYYQDDALYFGYSSGCSSTCSGSSYGYDYANCCGSGGVLRLVIGDDLDPTNWKLSKVIEHGPVTSAVAKLQDRKNHKLWLYYGTGRYYYNGDNYSATRRLYAVKEPCYTVADDLNPACTDVESISNLTDQTSASNATVNKGWYIGLDGVDTTDGLGAERVITDPVALTNGAVFYTTFQPTSDPCGFGGNSYLWGVRYDNGLEAPAAALEGKALVQVSTGSFEEIDLGSQLTGRNNRRLATPMTGKPPTDAPPIVTKANLKPVKRIIHIQER